VAFKLMLHCHRPPNDLTVMELNRQFNNSTFSDVGMSAETISEYIVYLANINAELPVGSKKTESEIAVKLLSCFDFNSNLGFLALVELLAPEAERKHWKPAVVAGLGVLAQPASRDLQGIQRFFDPLWRTIYDASHDASHGRHGGRRHRRTGWEQEAVSSAAPPQLSRAASRSVCPNTPRATAATVPAVIATARSLHCFSPGMGFQSGPEVLPPRDQVLPPRTLARLSSASRRGINIQATYLALQDAQYSALQRAPPPGDVSHLLVADLFGDPRCADPAVRKALNKLRTSASTNFGFG